MIGESMGFIDSQTLEEINNCEDQIKRRVPRGERVSLQAIGAPKTAQHFCPPPIQTRIYHGVREVPTGTVDAVIECGNRLGAR